MSPYSLDKHFYNIAEFNICVSFLPSPCNDASLVPSMSHFETGIPSGNLLFELTIDDTLRPVKKERLERIKVFDTGNGDTIVDRTTDGGYQFIIKDIDGRPCCLLIASKDFSSCKCALNGTRDMRQFGLNNALMLTFAFAGCSYGALLIHASLVRQNGWGYAFTAKSGTGKSTHVGLWLRHLPNCDMMNDDNPIIRIIDGTPYIYGGPWSGKTPCYRNVKAKLGAITLIDRAKENSIDRNNAIEAFGIILPACTSMKWDKDLFDSLYTTISTIIETTGVYILHCLPNKEAAILCNKAIAK